jgi:hypothetical protein
LAPFKLQHVYDEEVTEKPAWRQWNAWYFGRLQTLGDGRKVGGREEKEEEEKNSAERKPLPEMLREWGWPGAARGDGRCALLTFSLSPCFRVSRSFFLSGGIGLNVKGVFH